MNILRTDKEVALHDLLIISKESVDLYRDTAEFTDDQRVGDMMLDIVRQREDFIERFENCIRSLGNLPSEPDRDKETGKILLHHLQVSLSTDSTSEILSQHIEAENRLADAIDHGRAVGLDEIGGSLLDDFSGHVAQVRQRLQAARQRADG